MERGNTLNSGHLICGLYNSNLTSIVQEVDKSDFSVKSDARNGGLYFFGRKMIIVTTTHFLQILLIEAYMEFAVLKMDYVGQYTKKTYSMIITLKKDSIKFY
jgi:hypothetical protein